MSTKSRTWYGFDLDKTLAEYPSKDGSTTSVWELIFNKLVRSDRPTYSMRGNAIILDPAPYKKCKMKVTVDA